MSDLQTDVVAVAAMAGSVVANLLSWGGWQGVAGVAQIIAAVLSVVTIRQGRAMIAQADAARAEAARAAELARFEAVRPEWAQMNASVSYPGSGRHADALLTLRNVGRGPALHPHATFDTSNGYVPAGEIALRAVAGGQDVSYGSIPTNAEMMVVVPWDMHEPPQGTLRVRSISMLGEVAPEEFWFDCSVITAPHPSLSMEPYVRVVAKRIP